MNIYKSILKLAITISLGAAVVVGLASAQSPAEMKMPPYANNKLSLYQNHNIWRQMKTIFVAYAKPNELENVHYSYAYGKNIAAQYMTKNGSIDLKMFENSDWMKDANLTPANIGLGVKLESGTTAVLSSQAYNRLLDKAMAPAIDYIIFDQSNSKLEALAKKHDTEAKVLSNWNDCVTNNSLDDGFTGLITACEERKK